MGFSKLELAMSFLSKNGVCWGEFRVADAMEIFSMKRTSPARAWYIAEHLDDLEQQGYQTFVIIFINDLKEPAGILEKDKDYAIRYKSVDLDIVGDCYVHNITKGIFMIEATYNNDMLYEFYKLSINGLNNFAHRHINRCFSKTHWFKNYLNGNVFVDELNVYDIKHNVCEQNKKIQKLQENMLSMHYLEAGFSFEDLIYFLKKRLNKSNS